MKLYMVGVLLFALFSFEQSYGQASGNNLIVAINCGGPAYTAKDGTQFTADQYNISGGTWTQGNTDDIVGTEDDVLYKTERNGNFAYAIPVPAAGDYKVTLFFAEVYHGDAGKRLFNVSIEGQELLSNFDCVAEAGKNVAIKKVFELAIADGVINIVGTNIKDGGKISAIMIEKATVTDNAPPVSILSGWSAGQVKAKANGKNRILVVVTGTEHGGEISTTSITYGGQTMTKVGESVAGTTYREYSSIFILKDAGITAATSDQIQVTWSASLNEGFSISSAIYENVDQSVDPIGAISTTTTSSLMAPAMNVGSGDVYILGSALSSSYTSIDNGFILELTQLKNSTVDGTQLKWGNTVVHSKTGTGVSESAKLTVGSGRSALSAIVLKKAKNLIKTPVVQLDSWTAGTTKAKAAGTKRLLVATVSGEISIMNNLTDISLTYGGQVMSKAVFVAQGSTGFGTFTSIFTLNEAGIVAADETGKFVPTWTTTAPAGFDIFSSFYDKVDQTTPVSGTSKVNISANIATAPIVAAAFGDMVLMSSAYSGSNQNLTFPTGFTQLLKNPNAQSWGDASIAYFEGTGTDIAPSVNNTTSSNRIALAAIVLKQGEEEGLPPVYYKLAVNTPIGGKVKIDPIRTKYVKGTRVKLTATANFGFYFVNWTDSIMGVVTDTTSIVMNSDKVVTANFAEKIKYTITTEVSNGSIFLSPAGGTYYAGETVTVLAKENVGYKFTGWGGDLAADTTQNPTTIIVDSNKSISAIIEKIPAYKLTIRATDGIVKISPRLETYNPGSAVVLVAVPDEGYRFKGWWGDLTGMKNPTSMIMNSDMNLIAVFEKIPFYTLTISTSAYGTVSLDPSGGAVTLDPPGGIYEDGTIVTLTATPKDNYKFTGWSGDKLGSVNPTTIVMNGNRSVSAAFALTTGVNLNAIPENAMLAQNYPNPFSTTTTIPYQLNEASNVQLTVFNILGEKVKILVNEHRSAGLYEVVWDASDYTGKQVSKGIYFFRLEIGNSPAETIKSTLIK